MKLEEKIKELTSSPVAKTISQRMREFRDCPDAFSELCFCILTANASAQSGINTQQKIGHRFHEIPENELRAFLRTSGCRFYRNKCSYIVQARKHRGLRLDGFKNGPEAREWLVENVKGLGYKEASHLLRNTGFEDVAILDRHILKVMNAHGMIKDVPKSLTRKRYLEFEEKLREFSTRAGLSLGELDLYLWYMQTGKVLK
jgi:N-glycosylase/DNA lyase